MNDIFSLIRELRDILNDLDKIGAEVILEDDHISVVLDDIEINVYIYNKSYEVE